MDSKEEVRKVTKHPGRQAAGRRLAEWNRKNKENLLKNQKPTPQVVTSKELVSEKPTPQVVTSEELVSEKPTPQVVTTPSLTVSNLGYQLLPSVVVLTIVAGLYMYIKKPATKPAKCEPAPEIQKQRRKYM